MRILHVVTRAIQSGVQLNVRSLALGATRLGHEVQVASGEADGWLHEQLTAAGIASVTLDGLRRSWNPLQSLHFIRQLKRLCRDWRPDIVHFHSSNALIGAMAWNRRDPLRPRTVATIHGWSFLHPGWRGPIVLRLFMRLAMVRAIRAIDLIIYVCEHDRRLGEKIGINPKNFAVIHNGLDVTSDYLPRETARQAMDISPSKIVVGTVARLEPQKNLELLLMSIRRLLDQKFPSSRLAVRILGDGPEHQRLEKMVRAHRLTDVVRILPGHDAARLMRGLDVFVLSSHYEGFPYSLLEAALAHVPIVSTDVGGINELIANGISGRLVASNDPGQLSQAIREVLLDEQLRKKMSAQAYENTLTLFGEGLMLTKMIKQYEDLFNDAR